MSAPSARGGWARPLLWVALPLLGLTYQIASKETALALNALPQGASALAAAAAMPWPYLMAVVEVASFVVWMVVLSEIKLSEAFPMSALSYVAILVASWTLFHEKADGLQLVGSAAILTGVWLLGRRQPNSVSPEGG